MLLLSLLLVSEAEAKDLRQRVGVGYANQLPHIDALSVKLGVPTSDPAVNVQVQGLFGVSLLDDTDDALFAGGRVLYGIVAEDNLNLYAIAGAGYFQNGARSGFRLQPAIGSEFFLFGLENLGFSLEWGLTVDFAGGRDLYTVGSGAGLGVHYWF
jgi:hypothetical protein